MRVGAVRLLSAAILGMLLLCAPLSSEAPARKWQSGRVLAANLSGYGPSTSSRSKHAGKGDLWWTYCISSDGRTYSAVMRGSPARTGLEVNSPIRFSIVKNRMTVLNSRKESFVLRILRQGKEKICR